MAEQNNDNLVQVLQSLLLQQSQKMDDQFAKINQANEEFKASMKETQKKLAESIKQTHEELKNDLLALKIRVDSSPPRSRSRSLSPQDDGTSATPARSLYPASSSLSPSPTANSLPDTPVVQTVKPVVRFETLQVVEPILPEPLILIPTVIAPSIAPEIIPDTGSLRSSPSNFQTSSSAGSVSSAPSLPQDNLQNRRTSFSLTLGTPIPINVNARRGSGTMRPPTPLSSFQPTGMAQIPPLASVPHQVPPAPNYLAPAPTPAPPAPNYTPPAPAYTPVPPRPSVPFYEQENQFRERRYPDPDLRSMFQEVSPGILVIDKQVKVDDKLLSLVAPEVKRVLDNMKTFNAMYPYNKKKLFEFVPPRDLLALYQHERLLDTEISRVMTDWSDIYCYQNEILLMMIRRFIRPENSDQYEKLIYSVVPQEIYTPMLTVKGYYKNVFQKVNLMIDDMLSYDKLCVEGATPAELALQPPVRFTSINVKSKINIMLQCFGTENKAALTHRATPEFLRTLTSVEALCDYLREMNREISNLSKQLHYADINAPAPKTSADIFAAVQGSSKQTKTAPDPLTPATPSRPRPPNPDPASALSNLPRHNPFQRSHADRIRDYETRSNPERHRSNPRNHLIEHEEPDVYYNDDDVQHEVNQIDYSNRDELDQAMIDRYHFAEAQRQLAYSLQDEQAFEELRSEEARDEEEFRREYEQRIAEQHRLAALQPVSRQPSYQAKPPVKDPKSKPCFDALASRPCLVEKKTPPCNYNHDPKFFGAYLVEQLAQIYQNPFLPAHVKRSMPPPANLRYLASQRNAPTVIPHPSNLKPSLSSRRESPNNSGLSARKQSRRVQVESEDDEES